MRHHQKLAAFLFVGMLAALPARLVSAADTGDASAVNMKIYKMWVSPNTSCTNAVLVYDNASPSSQNMVSNPTLGTGSIASGTYPCVVFKMSDVVTGTPAYNSTSGHCTTSTNISIDVFRSGDSSTCPDGTGATGSGTNSSPVDDSPCLYMSTSGNASNSAWTPSSPFPLTSAFVVSGDTAGTFVADFRGKVVDDGSTCGINPPVFGFR